MWVAKMATKEIDKKVYTIDMRCYLLFVPELACMHAYFFRLNLQVYMALLGPARLFFRPRNAGLHTNSGLHVYYN